MATLEPGPLASLRAPRRAGLTRRTTVVLLSRYKVEWDTQSDFGSGSAGSIELPLVREVQSMLPVPVVNEEQHIRATVAVTNERQIVRTTDGTDGAGSWTGGVDEVQVIETTATMVANEVQTVTTRADDVNEVQEVRMEAPALPNEKQVVITDVAAPILEVQSVQIYANRDPSKGEVQEIVITFPKCTSTLPDHRGRDQHSAFLFRKRRGWSGPQGEKGR